MNEHFSKRPSKLIERLKDEAEKLENLDEICQKLCAFVVEGDDGREYDESLCDQQLAETVWSAISEASKFSYDENKLEQSLPRCRLSNAIVNAYKVYKDRLRDQLSTVGWEHARVVDMDWRISNVLETNEGKQSGSIAEIHFDTIATDSCDIEKISFQCDVNQLQDLLWTFKEAQNSLENLSKS
ncbi:unnamed protein product [Anisakis simplex]|uniref:COMM domain-containing protein 3 n=1 Tax=Anisakis simplex TaxID=6269 RepID=A0A0M3K797_ANISI|nr:unnamed protein product [Anisakis simplex]